MSIRIIAQELYRAKKKVEELRRIVSGSHNAEAERMARELREAEREMATLQKMLDAKKDTGQDRTPGFR